MSLALDTTGLATANRIQGEVITVTPAILATFGCVFPAQAPFFGGNFAITYTPTGGAATPLTQGIDYDFKFELPGFGDTLQSKVWGAIDLYNQGLNGTLTISYQALGGNWVFDQTAIKNYLNSTQFNSAVQFMALVSRNALYLPNNPNAEWPLNSIQSITIAQAQLPFITLSVGFELISGEDVLTKDVNILSMPLPPNSAQETGGNLAAVAAAMGTGGTAINQPSGGAGILGWLSGIFAYLAQLLTGQANTLAKLNSGVAASQAGTWGVGLNAGTNIVGGTFDAGYSEIYDSTTTSGFMYICQAEPGSIATASVWRIQRIDLNSGSVTWADGVSSFTKEASLRASYAYS